MGWWRFGTQTASVFSEEQREALKRIVAEARYELIPLDNAQEAVAALPPGACATVTASPSRRIEATLELTERVAASGREAIPHLAARMIRDRAHLKDLLERARAAGLRKAFVVGGDAKEPGEMRDGLDLLRAMAELGHPFEEVGVPAYPEGHAHIPDDVLMRALKDKQPYAQGMTTQMSFNPEAVGTWLEGIRGEGVTLPLWLGVAGPVELTRLLRIAAKIGVADSARYLEKNRRMLGRLMTRGSFGPDAFLETLAPAIADPIANVRGLHVFTFNQVDATADWQRRMLTTLEA